MTRLTRVQHAGHGVAVVIQYVRQDHRTDRVQVPDIVGNVLEMADVLSGIQINRNQRVGIQIVSGSQRTVQVWRGVAHHEIDPVVGEVYCRILPDTTAHRLIWVAHGLEVFLLCTNITQHVATGRIVGGPDANRVLRRCMKMPQQVTGLPVVGLYKSTDTVFPAIGSDQDLSIDRRRRHGFTVSQFRISDLDIPDQLPGLRVQRDQSGIKGAHVDSVAIHRNTAVVRPATIGRDWPHLMLVMPDLFTCFGIQCINMVKGRGDIHDPLNHDRTGLQGLDNLGLEDPGRAKIADVIRIYLPCRIVPSLTVVTVGMQEIVSIPISTTKHILGDGMHIPIQSP